MRGCAQILLLAIECMDFALLGGQQGSKVTLSLSLRAFVVSIRVQATRKRRFFFLNLGNAKRKSFANGYNAFSSL